MSALYNEIDPQAAEWLRTLILFDHIAPGVVDERSIEDLEPDYVASFTQVHFFAGIAVWSHALRRAGWADDRPIWTGSCPCQPFSAAGKGGGFDDERHLWPAFHHLIRECRPDVVLGEQVASKDGLAWLDLVQADLEGADYAVGALDTCAAGFGAPHIRQRLYWAGTRLEHAARDGRLERRAEPSGRGAVGGRGGIRLADADDQGWEGRLAERQRARERLVGPSSLASGLADADSHGTGHGPRQGVGEEAALDCLDRGLQGERLRVGIEGPLRGLADAGQLGLRGGQPGGLAGAPSADQGEVEQQQRLRPDAEHGGARGGNPAGTRPGPTNGLWRDADWLFCRDGRWRPVSPGTQPLAHGAPARVGRLRGYGNAIVAAQAQGFIEAVMDAL